MLEWQGSKSSASKSCTAEGRGDSSQGVALRRLGLVMQVSRQNMSSKDHQSHKAEQSLTLRGRPSSHLSAGYYCSEVIALPCNWKPMLLDSWEPLKPQNMLFFVNLLQNLGSPEMLNFKLGNFSCQSLLLSDDLVTMLEYINC